MKLFKKHKIQVEKVRNYANQNKVFVITMLVSVIFLLVNFVFVSSKNPQVENNTEIISESAEQAELSTQPQREIWRFYMIDVIILGAGGGLCLIMILRERKKSKEGLK